MPRRRSRRALMKGLAVLGIGGITGVGSAQESGTTIQLGGETAGWVGVAPDYIEGETNPTLNLEAGEEYTVEWENLDGQAHNFAIEGSDVQSEIITDGTQTVEFAATEQMTAYYCQPHSESMRGDINLGEAQDEQEESDEEEEPRQFDEPSEEPDGDPVATLEFTLTEEQWEAESPSEIEGDTNPTLNLVEGEIYEIEFSVETGRQRRHPGHYLVVFNEDGWATARTDFVKDGDSGSLKFVAESGVVGYRDQAQLDAEGEIVLH
ncbi:cupredoxin domain-containing protein [Halomontanus rarus]|uniref:cupredoxin domain-containing protein n=1 Tax=Halomontanus rarus TaxID=3034020 RepID=UPI001A97F562